MRMKVLTSLPWSLQNFIFLFIKNNSDMHVWHVNGQYGTSTIVFHIHCNVQLYIDSSSSSNCNYDLISDTCTVLIKTNPPNQTVVTCTYSRLHANVCHCQMWSTGENILNIKEHLIVAVKKQISVCVGTHVTISLTQMYTSWQNNISTNMTKKDWLYTSVGSCLFPLIH